MAAPLHLVLLGAPGAGKSTQARLLHARYPLQVLSTGHLLREEAARQTALGLLAESYLARGALLPDEVMVALITERLLRLPPDQGFLLDGFPRTLSQAEALQELGAKLRRPLTAVIALEVSEQEAVRRLGGRRMCEGLGAPFPVHIDDRASVEACLRLGGRLTQRPDDRPEVIRERLRTYEAETEPLFAFYEQRGLLARISAEGAPEAVHQAIVAVLEARRSTRG